MGQSLALVLYLCIGYNRRMNRLLFIHQFDQWQGLFGSQPIAPIIRGWNFTAVAVKALDGATWMNAYDTSTDAIKGVDSLLSWLQSFNSHGLAMDVWVVPTKDTLSQAIPLYAQILASLPGRLILDLEPYSGFWGDFSPLWPALKPLFDGVPTEIDKLAGSFDPRTYKTWPGLAFVLSRVRWRMPQVYDPSWMVDLYPQEQGPVWEPTLSTSSLPPEWSSIIRDPVLGNGVGVSGYGVFKGPLSDPEHIAWVKAHP